MKKNEEKDLYLPKDIMKRVFKTITGHPDVIFYKAIKYHKKYQVAKDKKNIIGMFIYGLKANKYSSKYNLELYGKYGKNLKIWHGNIVINSNAILGDNVSLHGNNCIGNNGKTLEAPKIGNNVDIGYGSIIIGDINIANNIKIGAGSVVNKSFLEENVVIAGVPARVVKRSKENDQNSCDSK